MKRILYLTLLLAFVDVLTQCEEKSGSSEKQLTYLTHTTGGCNGEGDLKNILNTESQDTVLFSINDNNELNLFVGINYICCAPFTTEVAVENDQITVDITDTCTDDNYCRCMCYYTWDFLFDNYPEKIYHYKVILHDPQQEDSIIFREGYVDVPH